MGVDTDEVEVDQVEALGLRQVGESPLGHIRQALELVFDGGVLEVYLLLAIQLADLLSEDLLLSVDVGNSVFEVADVSATANLRSLPFFSS